jgi:hypothetical protein
MEEMEIIVENVCKSWAIRLGESTPPGVSVTIEFSDVERLAEEIIFALKERHYD